MSKRKLTATEQWRELPAWLRERVVAESLLDNARAWESGAGTRCTHSEDRDEARAVARALRLAVRVLREAARRPRRA